MRSSSALASGGGLADPGVRVGQPVQGLGQRQGLSAHGRLQPGQGLVIQAGPVGHRRTPIHQQPLEIGGQLMGPAQAHPPDPGTPPGSRGLGPQGGFQFPVLELVDLQAEEQGVRRQPRQGGALVGLELGPGRIVPFRRRGEARIGGDAAREVHEALIERDGLTQQQAQPVRIGPGGQEGPLHPGQLCGGLAGCVDVPGQLWRLARRVEVGEVPAGQIGNGRHVSRFHGTGYGLSPSLKQRMGPRLPPGRGVWIAGVTRHPSSSPSPYPTMARGRAGRP